MKIILNTNWLKSVLTRIAFTAVIALPLPALAQVSHLVISQVYGGGGNAGATYINDYIEIFNPTGSTVSLTGWSVQYAASAGTSWTVTNLSGSIAPGHYYLVQEQSGGAIGAAIPTPNATGTINLSATSGKVILINSTTAQSTSCPSGQVDFIGYGSANCSELSNGTAPAGANNTSLTRAGGGCTDADNNSTDFTAITPVARNSSTTALYCYPTKLVISSISPNPPAAGAGFSVTVQSQDAGSNLNPVIAGTAFTLTTNGLAGVISGTVTGTIAAGTSSVTVSGVKLASSTGGASTATLTATRTSGDALTAGTSATFIVNAANCSGTPAAGTISPAPSSLCGSGTSALTLSGGSSGGGISYQWSSSATNSSPGTAIPGATNFSYTTPTLTATTYYWCTTTCSVSALSSITATGTVTVNTVPTVNVTPAGGVSPVSMTASGASTYSWSPAFGLSATTGAAVTSSASVTTTYTVTGTSAAGCTATSTATVTNVNGSALWDFTAGTAAASSSSNPNVPTSGTSSAIGNSYGTVGAPIAATAASSVTDYSTASGTNNLGNAAAGASTGNASFNSGTSPYLEFILTPNTGYCLMVSGMSFGERSTGTGPLAYTISTDVAGFGTGIATGSWSNDGNWHFYTPSFSSFSGAPNTAVDLRVYGYNGAGSAATNAINWRMDDITVNYTANPIPTVSAGATATICRGSSTTLTATGGTAYSWTPATGLSAATGASVTASPTVTTTYTVTGTLAGCTATATVMVSVNPLPTIGAGSGVAICTGASASLTATGGATYSWSPATGLSATTGASVTASPTVTTTYTVTGTNSSGCANTATVMVTVNALPAISGGAGATICSGAATALTATGGTTYTWSPGTGLSATTGATLTASPATTTTYTVTGTNSNGCTNTAPVTVSVNALPAVSGGANVAICAGTTTPLTATGGATYSWSPATGLSATTGASIMASPATTTTYTVAGTSGAGCSNTAIVTVTVNAVPVIGAGTTATICAGSSTTLTATGGTTYSWLPGTGLSATTGASVSASPATSTTYTVTGTSAAGCSNTATVMVSVNALPVISSGASLAICSGQSAALTAMGGIAYSWLPGTGLSATTGAAIMASPTSTTTYTVTGSNAAGCTSTATTTVTVNPLAGAGTIVGATGVCNGSSTTLSNPTAPGGVWSASSGVATIGSASGIVTGMGMGAVTISYTVTNIFACVSVTTSVMNVEAIPGFTYTLSGNGTAASTGDGGPAYLATMRAPRAVCTDNTGNLYICDVSTNVIRKVTPAGIISTVAGNGVTGTAGAGGQATAAQLSMSGGGGIYADASGNLYIANTFVHTIEKVTAATGIITVIAGNGTSGYSGDGAAATAAKISSPMGLCGDAAGNIYFADMGSHRIRKITPSGIISTIIGTGSAAFSGDGGPGTAARVNYPKDVATDNNGNLYIGDASNNVVRKYVIATGIITTVAGTGAAGNTGDGGAAVSATFSVTSRVAVDRGNNLYICDQNNNKVRQVNMNTGIVTSVAFTGANGFSGDGGPSTSATLFIPGGIACDQNGYLYISDCNNRRVRIANVGGSLRITLAGPTSVPVGTPITFTAYSAVTGSNATLQWQKNGINVSGATSTTYTNPSPVNGDVYRCILTVTPECGTATTATSNSIALAVYRAAPEPNTVSTANANVSLTAYPNPARESMIVAAEGIDNGVVTLTMFDQTGKIVMSRETTATNNKLSEAIDMQSVAPGLYIISVRDASGNVARLKCVKGQ